MNQGRAGATGSRSARAVVQIDRRPRSRGGVRTKPLDRQPVTTGWAREDGRAHVLRICRRGFDYRHGCDVGDRPSMRKERMTMGDNSIDRCPVDGCWAEIEMKRISTGKVTLSGTGLVLAWHPNGDETTEVRCANGHSHDEIVAALTTDRDALLTLAVEAGEADDDPWTGDPTWEQEIVFREVSM